MRILYFCPDRGIPVLGDKGASVHVRSFVTALSRLGHEVVLVCAKLGEGNPAPDATIIELPQQQNDSALWHACDAEGIDRALLKDQAIRSEVRKLAHDAAMAGQVREALAARGFVPDLMYERHALFNVAGVAIARALAIPRLLEVNAPIVQEQARYRGLFLHAQAEARERTSLRAADLVVAVSNEVRVFVLTRGVAPGRAIVAINGVDTGRFNGAVSGAAIRAELSLGDAPVIGFIGSFKPWHGMDVLLSAFATIVHVRPRAKLLAVGDGPMLAAARAQVTKLGLDGQAELPGAVPHAEVPAYLAAMDLTVAPYTPHADFYFSPLKVVESLASGRPVVAPRVGQLTSLIEDGQTGQLYPPGDLPALTNALLALIDDPARRRRIGTQAALQARLEWDWTSVAARILARARPPAAASMPMQVPA